MFARFKCHGTQNLSTTSTYGYLNSSKDIVTPQYPYVIERIKGYLRKVILILRMEHQKQLQVQ